MALGLLNGISHMLFSPVNGFAKSRDDTVMAHVSIPDIKPVV
jgi:hypothetical protein